MPTIGVAIEVPEPWGSHLQAYRTRLGDDAAELIPTHITVLPPHDVSAQDLAEIEAHLATAAHGVNEFEVHLAGTGTFRPVSPVVFVSLQQGMTSCQALADAVKKGPLAVEVEFPYHPHVTIAHHLPDDVLDQAHAEFASFDVTFAVQHLTLYVYHDDEGWLPTHRFPLQRG